MIDSTVVIVVVVVDAIIVVVLMMNDREWDQQKNTKLGHRYHYHVIFICECIIVQQRLLLLPPLIGKIATVTIAIAKTTHVNSAPMTVYGDVNHPAR